MQGGKPCSFNTPSFNPLVGDTATTSVEGLRKLALNYKTTVQGKLDIEKFRSTCRTAKKPFDPRFRRTRPDTTMTKSDTKVPSPFHPGKQLPKSLPVVSSMPSSPKRSPRKKSRCPVRMRSQLAADVINSSEDTDGNLEDTAVQAEVPSRASTEESKPRAFRRINSFVERGSRKEEVRNELKPFTTTDTGTLPDPKLASVGNIVVVDKCDEQTETKEVMHTSQMTSGDGKRTLDTYTSPPLEIKATHEETMSKSVITMPYSSQSADHRVCVKCARTMHAPRKRSFDCNTSMAGTNTIIQALEYSELQAKQSLKESMWLMWSLYAFGCFCGLILVSCFAWVMSNDMLWKWVYQPKEPPPKARTLLSLVSYCGASVVFAVNLLVDTAYKIIMLPRNSVFGPADEEVDSRW